MFPDDELTDDAFLGGALRIWQPKTGYRAATDSVFLAASVPAGTGQQILELGCGAGVASLCLWQRTGACATGVEVQPAYADLARRNAIRNDAAVEVVQADLSALPDELRCRSFDHVIANPPWFAAGRGTEAVDEGRERAHREVTPLAQWLDVAARRLAPKGWLSLIHRADRLHDLLAGLPPTLGSVVVQPLQARIGQPPGRIILQARKAGRAPFRLNAPFIVHDGRNHAEDGDDFTQTASWILRQGGALRI